jgi:Mrp family chromosome partitioning ATPase
MKVGFDDYYKVISQGETSITRPSLPSLRTVSKSIMASERDRYSTREIAKLVQRLFVSTERAAPHVVIVAGVEQGSGATSVCTKIAEFLASHVDGSVCLVDANPHSQSEKSHFHIEDGGKVMDSEWIFSPVRHAAHPQTDSNWWLLSYRPENGGFQTPLTLERFQTRIAELRKDFNYVLVDAPPVNDYADAALFGKFADGLVLVVEAHKTRRDATIRAKKTLDEAAVALLGAVLNKRTFPIPRFLYKWL